MTELFRSASRAAIAGAAVASALAYPFLPERVAVHFNSEGEPDRYGSRLSAALTLPALMTGLQVLNDRLGAWPGNRDREDKASGAEAREEAIGLVELALFPTQLAILAKALGAPVDMRLTAGGVYGALMVGLGNVLPRLPRNGLAGIRTPWTLADPTVWERTHRLAGYLLTASGLLSLASLPLRGKYAARIPLFTTLGTVAISSLYSFLEYRRRAGAGH